MLRGKSNITPKRIANNNVEAKPISNLQKPPPAPSVVPDVANCSRVPEASTSRRKRYALLVAPVSHRIECKKGERIRASPKTTNWLRGRSLCTVGRATSIIFPAQSRSPAAILPACRDRRNSKLISVQTMAVRSEINNFLTKRGE